MTYGDCGYNYSTLIPVEPLKLRRPYARYCVWPFLYLKTSRFAVRY